MRLTYHIAFKVVPYVPGERWVWPLTFVTRLRADAYLFRMAPSMFAQNIPGRRIVSASVQHSYKDSK